MNTTKLVVLGLVFLSAILIHVLLIQKEGFTTRLNATNVKNMFIETTNELIKKFNEYSGIKIILNDSVTKYNRLDRAYSSHFADMHELRRKISSGLYSDYHCLRPHSEHQDTNNFIVDSLAIRPPHVVTSVRKKRGIVPWLNYK